MGENSLFFLFELQEQLRLFPFELVDAPGELRVFFGEVGMVIISAGDSGR